MANNSSHTGNIEAASKRGGYFPGILLPPFAVILVGLIIALVSGGIIVDNDVNASSFLDDAEVGSSGDHKEGMSANLTIPSDGERFNGSRKLASLFTPEVLYWEERILEWSDQFDLDPNLIATVMQIESCGFRLAQSHAGAMGLFQVMPFHFEINENPYEIDSNARRGLNYLKSSLETSAGDVSLALAGYNGGISIITNSSDSWVDETQRYVYWGSGIYEEAIQGKETSQRLAQWLSHGGASLCQQASSNLGLNP